MMHKDLGFFAFPSPSSIIGKRQKCKKTSSNKIVSVVSSPKNKRSPSATGSVTKIPMTATEKILARAAEKCEVRPGENAWANVDVLMINDITCPGISGIFKKEFGNTAKVWDREKIVVIPDHYIFTNDERAHRNVDIARDFCVEQDIKYFYDIQDRSNFRANPDYKGVCHVALAQEGHCRPGEVLFGTDSHTTSAGAFGQFATGVGNTDAAFVPPTLRFVLDGEKPSYLLAKDLILNIIGEISVSGATYKTMEFVGTTIESLSMEERMTLCNMVIEAGGKNGIVAADRTTYKYLEDKTSAPYEPVSSDENARQVLFLAQYRFDVSNMEPLVAKVWMDLYTLEVPDSGGKTCSMIFEEAGCDPPASPSCAACMGGPRDTYGRLNEPQVCVSTTNRNFPGRMGHMEGQIYLASPYTAAASALTGFVTDPREFL
ncbi:3-isopropylmalate dehydratase large subunit, chloroplastic [Glycine soja]